MSSTPSGLSAPSRKNSCPLLYGGLLGGGRHIEPPRTSSAMSKRTGRCMSPLGWHWLHIVSPFAFYHDLRMRELCLRMFAGNALIVIALPRRSSCIFCRTLLSTGALGDSHPPSGWRLRDQLVGNRSAQLEGLQAHEACLQRLHTSYSSVCRSVRFVPIWAQAILAHAIWAQTIMFAQAQRLTAPRSVSTLSERRIGSPSRRRPIKRCERFVFVVLVA